MNINKYLTNFTFLLRFIHDHVKHVLRTPYIFIWQNDLEGKAKQKYI